MHPLWLLWDVAPGAAGPPPFLFLWDVGAGTPPPPAPSVLSAGGYPLFFREEAPHKPKEPPKTKPDLAPDDPFWLLLALGLLDD